MKRFIIIIICCVIPMVHSRQVSAWDYPLDVVITEISFNYPYSVAITLKKNYGDETISAPEWHFSGGQVVKK
jgi:hypothetical protein